VAPHSELQIESFSKSEAYESLERINLGMSEIVEALNRIQAARAGEGAGIESLQAVAEPIEESVIEVSQEHPSDLRDFFTPTIFNAQSPVLSTLVESSESKSMEPEFDQMLVEDWLHILQKEYVRSYIRDGGSAVKFAISSSEDARPALQTGLSALAKEEGLLFARVDGRFTKMHMVDRLFFKIAKQMDWDELAYNFLAGLVREKGYQVPDKWEDFSLTKLAQLNDRKEALLWKDLQMWIEKSIEVDLNLCQEFRMAMICLCVAQLQASEADLNVAQSVKEWLRGELRLISSVKHALIFQKISRNNGRHMLTSLTHWLRRTKKAGLLLTFDMSRYLVAKKPSEPDSTFYYSGAAVLDLYDTLRQFIDNVDDHAGCLIVVLAPKEFLSDRRRGLDRYEALKLRIWDDVRDKYQQNPLAPMVRLSTSPAGVRHHALGIGTTPLHQGAASLRDRRVIEGLRAGVPNHDVIQVMGCYQPEVEGRFERMLEAVDQRAAEGQSTRGMIVEGGFGTGKSHVLAYLQDLALQQQCICSRVIISKETPLYHPLKVFQAAVESAVMPGQAGQVLVELANRIDVWSPAYQELSDWVHDYRNGMDQRFAATMFLFQRMSTEPEMCHRVTRFWSGEPLAMNEIRACLRQCGVFQNYSFARIREVDLAIQRFRFAAKLMRLAGYRGWVVFLDEAELIGRYSFVQRLKAYAELSRMLGTSTDVGVPGLASVVALTDDFQSEILEAKGDRARVLDALGKVGTTAQLEKHAEEGVRFIEWDATPLRELTEVRVEEAYHKIRQLHYSVYGEDQEGSGQTHEPPPSPFKGKRMREWVKSWVTEWDLKRLLACEHVDIQIRSVKQEYQEDRNLDESEEEIEPSTPSEIKLSNMPEPSVQAAPIEKKPNPFAAHLSATSESIT
jgi:BREX system ATP-binding protein BrxC/D